MLEEILSQFIAFLTWAGMLAGAVQLAINQLKPYILTPLKDRLSEEAWLASIYALRTLITIIGFFSLWGGVDAARDQLPIIASNIPDVGIAIVSILIIVLGQEVIHVFIDRLYLLRDTFRKLENPTGEDEEPMPEGQVNVAPSNPGNPVG